MFVLTDVPGLAAAGVVRTSAGGASALHPASPGSARSSSGGGGVPRRLSSSAHVTPQPGSGQPPSAAEGAAREAKPPATEPSMAGFALADAAPAMNGHHHPPSGDVSAVAAAAAAGQSALMQLCSVHLQTVLPTRPLHLRPRGFVNTGNSCFMNATIQAMLGCSAFCAFMHLLKQAAPQLHERELPMLQGLSLLAAEFAAGDEPAAEEAGEDGWAKISKGGKKTPGAKVSGRVE